MSKQRDSELTHSRSSSTQQAEELRVDKWLWFARFFKSRSQATEAVAGGLVHVNGERTKPAHTIHCGDLLNITRGESRFEVVVKSLPTRRGPAVEAQASYEETADSAMQRQKKLEQLKIAAPAPFGRPDKQDRRALRNLRERNRE